MQLFSTIFPGLYRSRVLAEPAVCSAARDAGGEGLLGVAVGVAGCSIFRAIFIGWRSLRFSLGRYSRSTSSGSYCVQDSRIDLACTLRSTSLSYQRAE